MSRPFIGEIKMFAGTFAPKDWAFCDGQLLDISEYDALFQLLGTTYGGDGERTFGVPDLRGRAPVCTSPGRDRGVPQGVETVTVSAAQIPRHRHDLVATTDLANQANPDGAALAKTAGIQPYGAGTPVNALAAVAIDATAGGPPAAHQNMQPFLAINCIISLAGVFPPTS